MGSEMCIRDSVSVIVWVDPASACSVFSAGVPWSVVVSENGSKPVTSIGKLPTPPCVILRTVRPTGGGWNVFVYAHVTVSPSARPTSTPRGRAGFGSGFLIVLVFF